MNRGETVHFKIKTDATAYRLDIYRLGYYGGMGARKMATVQPSVPLPQIQPPCLTDSATGLIDCGNWAESAAWTVPLTARSGVYVARLVRSDTGGASHIVFILRDDSGGADVLFQTSDTTWQAYNNYDDKDTTFNGGRSLYTGPGTSAQRAFKVSYNRPFKTAGDKYSRAWLFNIEYPMIRWLEANGYNVSYFSGVDTARRGAELLEHKVFLSVGHDEYWSADQRAHVEAARNAGVHLGFFSGNEVFWKTRWESSIDGSNRPYRTLVSYKETHADAKIDPLPNVWTGTWRDSRFSPPADAGRPENALTGTIFMVNCCRQDSMTVPEVLGKFRFWRNTSVATLPSGATATLPAGLLGYEWDEEQDNGSRPRGLVSLSRTVVIDSQLKYLQNEGTKFGPGQPAHSLTFYRHLSGALVFGAGTIRWPWGLDGTHGSDPATPGATTIPDVRIQQATVNLLADMGVQPATLQPGLVAATQSTDATAPTSVVTSPTAGATVHAGIPVTIMGTATDGGGGVVAAVEVSVDGGATWRRTTGLGSWSYAWAPETLGPVTIRSSAVDDSGNIQMPAASVAVNVVTPPVATCPCTIWDDATTPAITADADSNPVELGVKFRSDLDGFVVGLRFYKGTSNTGTHVGHLWTATGAPLASVSFSNETASGWQQAAFPTPVPITKNTTYVASYHTPVGHYAANVAYFTALGVYKPPLRALGSTNGVFKYGASGFPTQTASENNYWVDVVFSTAAGPDADTTPPTVSSVAPAVGATGVSAGAALTAILSEPIDPATVTSTTVELRASSNALVPTVVTYSSSTRTVTTAPVSALAPSTSYAVTIKGGPVSPGVKDLAGNSLAASFTWSFTTAPAPVCPCRIWNSSTVPEIAADADANEVEVGVRFRSDLDGVVAALRFYKGAGNIGPHVGHLWTGTGTLLATVTFTSETASGWQEAAFPSPVPVAANTTYVASYHAPAGHYATNSGFFSASPAYTPPLRALGGVFVYGGSGFPNQSFGGNNYWVDVVLQTALADTTPPAVTAVFPVPDAAGVSTTIEILAGFSESIDPMTIGINTMQMRDPSNVVVPAAVTYNATTLAAKLTPLSPLAPSTIYTVIIKGGNSDPRAKDVSGNALAQNFTSQFTTGGRCPCSIWTSAPTPTVAADPDAKAVEVGVKFRSDLDGFITALRFYKGPSNTGTHVGHLWSSTGTLLASVTFSNETASGWQETSFPSPVPIVKNTTYVASYHTTVGHYAVDPAYFLESGASRPPLHIPSGSAAGGNGVFGYGASRFPSQSYNGNNYWVDVIFNTTSSGS